VPTRRSSDLQVDNAVADIVGGFHQKSQRMPAPAVLAIRNQTNVVGYCCERFLLRLEIAEFLLALPTFVAFGKPRGAWVFCEGPKTCVREPEAVLVFIEDSKALSVSLKSYEIFPLMV